MGRKRKYEGTNEKERVIARVKACREKKKLNNISKATSLLRIERAQKKIEGRRGYQRIQEKEITCNEVMYLTKKNDTDEYVIFLRGYDPVANATSATIKDSLSLSDGMVEFKKITSEDRDNFWFSFDSTRDSVRAFIKAYQNGKEKELLWGNKFYSFRFIAMLNEVAEDEGGGDLRKIKKNVNPNTLLGRHCIRREIVSFLPTLVFTRGQTKEETKRIVENSIVSIVEKMLEKNNQGVRFKSCKQKIGLFRDILKVLCEFPRVYDVIDPDKMLKVIDDSIIQILDSYRKKKHKSQESGLTDSDNNPYIPIKYLKKILDYAWETSTSLYYFIILSLSVGAREEEMRRLINNPGEYILDDGALDYCNQKRRKNISDFLVQKTVGKIDITTLTNPRLAIVSRMILLYEKPNPSPSRFFKDKKNGFRSNIELNDYHERCLRTTCATMLAYCTKLNNQGRSSFSDVQVRLGHADSSMAIRVYAKKIPSDRSPTSYLGIKPSTVIGDIDLTAHSTLWDTWLLKDYLKRKEECFESKKVGEVELLQFYNDLIKETEFFNRYADEDEANLPSEDNFQWIAGLRKKTA
ncbi:MAG: hypothetical protein HOP07_10385 [Bacteriovoracaceae bacterium]|nr:hypothetical protein [Bacteriovoracaceae bacterium]